MCLSARVEEISGILRELKRHEDAINEIHKMENNLSHLFCETLINEEKELHRRISQWVIEWYNTNDLQQRQNISRDVDNKTRELIAHTGSLNELLTQNNIIYKDYISTMEIMAWNRAVDEHKREVKKYVISDEEKQRIKDNYKKEIEEEARAELYGKISYEIREEERRQCEKEIQQLQRQVSESGKLIDKLKQDLRNANSIIQASLMN